MKHRIHPCKSAFLWVTVSLGAASVALVWFVSSLPESPWPARPQAPFAWATGLPETPEAPGDPPPSVTDVDPHAADNWDIELIFAWDADINERKRAILRLVKRSPSRAEPILHHLIDNEYELSRLRLAAAQALAVLSPDPAVGEALAHHPDPIIARGAIRGIAAHDEGVATELLSQLLFDPNIPTPVRIEAAINLSRLETPEAFENLLRATYSDIDAGPAEPVLHEVLRGLVSHHYERVADFVEGILAHPEIDSAAKTALLAGMAHAPDRSASHALFQQARSDDPAIREAAIWSIVGQGRPGVDQAELLDLLRQESVSWVRSTLYEALRQLDHVPMHSLWNEVIGETDVSTRIRGYNLIAAHVTPSEVTLFDQTIVPELQQIAQENSSLTDRVGAVIALGRAPGSAAAAGALRQLTQDGPDPETRRAAEIALRNQPQPAN